MPGQPGELEVAKIVALFKTKNETEIVSHASLENATGLDRKADPARYYRIAGKARRRIRRDLGIRLQTVHGVGYRIPDGKMELTGNRETFARGMRMQARAVRDTAGIDNDRLPDIADRAQRDGLISAMQQVCDFATQRLSLLLDRSETNPQPALPNP